MSESSRKPLGVPQGLNLGADPAQTAGLIAADGLRYDESGILTSRPGRKLLSLDFPDEGHGTDTAKYVENIPHLVASAGGVRGYAEFYDQRIYGEAAEVLRNGDFEDFPGDGQDAKYWSRTGGWIDAQGAALYDQASGSPGLLTQATADFWHENPSGAVEYELTYSIAVINGTAPALQIDAGFAAVATPLANTDGTHKTRFVAAATPTDFVIRATSGVIGRIYLDAVSLRRVKLFGVGNIPQRLNVLYKDKDGHIYLNEDKAGVSPYIEGTPDFEDPSSRVKFVQFGRDVYIIDEYTRPKVFSRKLPQDQEHAERVRYEIRNASYNWPKLNSPRPLLTIGTGAGPFFLRSGYYTFRVQFQDRRGVVMAPSLARTVNINQGVEEYIKIDYNHLLGDPELADVEWASVFYQYTDTSVQQTDPSAYWLLWRQRVGETRYPLSDTANQTRLYPSDLEKGSSKPTLTSSAGAMPKLIDFKVVNGIGYGIAAYDTIFREVTRAGQGTPNRELPSGIIPEGEQKSYDNTEIQEIQVNPTILMVSEPGEPYRMERWYPIADGNQVGVGLSSLGEVVYVHTNQGVHAFTDDPPTFKRVPTGVGLLVRDSLQEDERMVRFMGADAVPRLFNGAIVEESATELLPVFDQEDYEGFYQPFDRSNAKQVSSASGKRRYFLNFPTAPNGGAVQHKAGGAASNALAIADMARGRALWSIDRVSYEQIMWLGRESRLSGVDNNGRFYFLEEGFEDEHAIGESTSSPRFWGAVRWFGRAGATTRFFQVSLEADTKGTDVTLKCQVDKNPDLQIEFTVNTTSRKRLDFYLPGYFKGLYLDTLFNGSTTTAGRVRISDVKVDMERLGV
jgi:hypothetical protein